MAILLFLARREGLTVEEFAEVLWENAAGGHDEDDEEAHEEIAEARAEWEVGVRRRGQAAARQAQGNARRSPRTTS